MLVARKTRNLRGSFRPRLPWTEKRSGRFRNYRPERSTFQCSRTATTNRSTHIIPHGSGKRRGRGNLRNQEDFAARNEYRLKDLPTLLKTRRDLPEIGRFSSRRECLRSLCWSLSFCAEANHQVSRMRHGTRALSLLVRLFNLMKTADYLAGWELFSARAWGLASLFERNPVTPLPSIPFGRLACLRFSPGVLRDGHSARLHLPGSCKIFANCGSERKAKDALARRNAAGKSRRSMAMLP